MPNTRAIRRAGVAAAVLVAITATVGCAQQPRPTAPSAIQAIPASTAVHADQSAIRSAAPPSKLGPDAYGALKLGMSMKQALATNELRNCTHSPNLGDTCQLRDAPTRDGLVCISTKLGVDVISLWPGLRTAEGIGEGSLRGDVAVAYPNLKTGINGSSVPVPQNVSAEYAFNFDEHDRVSSLALELPNQDCNG